MVVSALLTIALVPLAGIGLRRSRQPAPGQPESVQDERRLGLAAGLPVDDGLGGQADRSNPGGP